MKVEVTVESVVCENSDSSWRVVHLDLVNDTLTPLTAGILAVANLDCVSWSYVWCNGRITCDHCIVCWAAKTIVLVAGTVGSAMGTVAGVATVWCVTWGRQGADLLLPWG